MDEFRTTPWKLNRTALQRDYRLYPWSNGYGVHPRDRKRYADTEQTEEENAGNGDTPTHFASRFRDTLAE
jgi:hypothetical protein